MKKISQGLDIKTFFIGILLTVRMNFVYEI